MIKGLLALGVCVFYTVALIIMATLGQALASSPFAHLLAGNKLTKAAAIEAGMSIKNIVLIKFWIYII